MPERLAAADLFLALGGRSRDHVNAMGGGGCRQERMLVSIIGTRDTELEDLGSRGIAHVTKSGDFPKRAVLEAGGVKELTGVISRRELASPTQVIAMQALLNISSYRPAMSEIGKQCLETLMELNAEIVIAREDRALKRRPDVSFEMLSEELRLCVGGVLENISKDKDNRTRVHKLELKMASEQVHAAKVAAAAAKSAAAAAVGHRLDTTNEDKSLVAATVTAAAGKGARGGGSSAAATDSPVIPGSILHGSVANSAAGAPPAGPTPLRIRLPSVAEAEADFEPHQQRHQDLSPVVRRPPGAASAVTERAHRRLMQSVAESNHIDLDAVVSPTPGGHQHELHHHHHRGGASSLASSAAPSPLSSSPGPHNLSSSPGPHNLDLRSDVLSRVVAPQASAAVNVPPHTFEEHASYVWERAFTAVLREVLPGVRQLMRSKPTSLLEITNPQDYARREHTKSVLAAKAAAEVAAKEAEAKAAESMRLLREKMEAKKMAAARMSTGSGGGCLLYTSPSPRDATLSRMPSSA